MLPQQQPDDDDGDCSGRDDRPPENPVEGRGRGRGHARDVDREFQTASVEGVADPDEQSVARVDRQIGGVQANAADPV